MFVPLAPVSLLLIPAGILLLGNGLQGTLMAVRGYNEGFSPVAVGALTSFYYAGFIIGCWLGPVIIRRMGYIRAFAIFAAVGVSVPLLHALIVQPLIWNALRLLNGICMSAFYMIIESWLNEKAGNEWRGLLISVYRITDLETTTGGLMLLTAADPRSYSLFSIVAILICLALVPVGLSGMAQFTPLNSTRLRLGRLYTLSPLGVAGCLGFGASNGVFAAMTPVYAQSAGLSAEAVAHLLAASLIGGALSQWPVGYLSDRIDRRHVLSVMLFGASVSGLLLIAAFSLAPALITFGTLLLGAMMVPLYSLCIAHANDYMTPSDFVEANSGLLLMTGISSANGPMLAAWLMHAADAQYLFGFTAAVHACTGLFALHRMRQRPPNPTEEKSEFQPMPGTSPVVFELGAGEEKSFT